LPGWLLKKLSFRAKENFDISELYKNIDWSRTKAYGVTEAGIYVNLKGRDAEGIIEADDYDDIRDEIIEKLSAIADPRTGEPLSPQIFKKEQVYHGEHLDSAPDIVFLIPPYTQHAAMAGETEWIGLSDSQKLGLSGWHRQQGVFMACGPDVRKNREKLTNLKIYDIAPTVLHMFGLPVPSDMDGRVLGEIFLPDSEIARRSVVYQSVEEKGRVKGRIRKLKDSGII
jgi:predicted AlkP superfamily phosphohydrolase/phosphomutase